MKLETIGWIINGILLLAVFFLLGIKCGFKICDKQINKFLKDLDEIIKNLKEIVI